MQIDPHFKPVADHFFQLTSEQPYGGAALTYVDKSGTLTRTSAGTVLQLIPFGYSVIRSDRMQLWGQGLAPAAITALLAPQKNALETLK
jgi:hypothetical protein